MTLEIEFLKNQINPHFFNNELNSVYALLDKEDIEGSKDYIKDLSEYLVYSLKNNMNDFVLLKDELNSIFGYLDNLERRNDGALKIDYTLDGKTDRLQIHPLILMTFVENAIKHSRIEYDTKAFIQLNVHILESTLAFSIVNNNALEDQSKVFSTNIGLQNVKKRLELQYKNRYEISINNDDNEYQVILKLKLNEQE